MCLLVWGAAAMGQDLSEIGDVSDNSLVFIDSVENKNGLVGLDPATIALIDIVRGAKVKEIYGARGEHGVIFIETVNFARKRYTRMFSEFSAEYADALRQHGGTDTSFLYVVDGFAVEKNVPQVLAALERKNIDTVEVAVPETGVKKDDGHKPGEQKLQVLIHSKRTK